MLGQVPLGRVIAVTMFVTARFDAFLARAEGLEPGEVGERVFACFRAQYEVMLRENLAQILSSRRGTGL